MLEGIFRNIPPCLVLHIPAFCVTVPAWARNVLPTFNRETITFDETDTLTIPVIFS